MSKPDVRHSVVNKAIAWNALNLSEAVKSIRFDVDDEGNIKGMPVVLFDPYGIPTAGAYPNSFFPRGLTSIVDADNPASIGKVAYPSDSNGRMMAINVGGTKYSPLGDPAVGATQFIADRGISTYKTVETAAAPATTDLWTPAGGKKFRILGGTVTMGGSIAALAKRSLKLVEETAGTIFFACGIDIPVLGANIALSFDFRPNGILATTADKKLQVVTAGATYVTGSDWVTVYGCEEA